MGGDDIVAGRSALADAVDPTVFRVVSSSVLLTLLGVVVGETVTSVNAFRRNRRLTNLELNMISNGIIMSSILFWPVLWDFTVGYARLLERPRIIFGFFWPILISTMDLRYAADKRRDVNQETMARTLNMDAQAVISAAFAMGALMTGLKSTRGTHIIMYALIMSLALVVPQIAAPNHTRDRTVVMSVQKASLNYAIGYIVAGIGMDFLSGGAQKPVFDRM